MVNGFQYYRALESVSIASALSTTLTIYPCQIRVHQRWQSKCEECFWSGPSNFLCYVRYIIRVSSPEEIFSSWNGLQ